MQERRREWLLKASGEGPSSLGAGSWPGHITATLNWGEKSFRQGHETVWLHSQSHHQVLWGAKVRITRNNSFAYSTKECIPSFSPSILSPAALAQRKGQREGINNKESNKTQNTIFSWTGTHPPAFLLSPVGWGENYWLHHTQRPMLLKQLPQTECISDTVSFLRPGAHLLSCLLGLLYISGGNENWLL